MTTKPMTVGDLIDALSVFDMSYRVVIGDGNFKFARDICEVDNYESLIDIDGEKVIIIEPTGGELKI